MAKSSPFPDRPTWRTQRLNLLMLPIKRSAVVWPSGAFEILTVLARDGGVKEVYRVFESIDWRKYLTRPETDARRRRPRSSSGIVAATTTAIIAVTGPYAVNLKKLS